jgi:hypothetical protein
MIGELRILGIVNESVGAGEFGIDSFPKSYTLF